MSVAPMILSASRPLSNGEILSLFSFFAFSFSSSDFFESLSASSGSLFRRDVSFLVCSSFFSFSFSLFFSFRDLSFSSESAFRFLLSLEDSSFFELTVEPSFELLLFRRFFFSEFEFLGFRG